MGLEISGPLFCHLDLFKNIIFMEEVQYWFIFVIVIHIFQWNMGDEAKYIHLQQPHKGPVHVGWVLLYLDLSCLGDLPQVEHNHKS